MVGPRPRPGEVKRWTLVETVNLNELKVTTVTMIMVTVAVNVNRVIVVMVDVVVFVNMVVIPVRKAKPARMASLLRSV